MSTARRSRDEPAASDRRQEVVRAVWRVIAREGLDRTSMRAIAQELGTTTGVITHYFRDKEDMLDFVLKTMIEGLNASGRFEGPTPYEDAIESLISSLPMNQKKVGWWKVWLSFTVAAFSHPRQASLHASAYVCWRENWEARLRSLRDAGVLRADIDPALEAASLLCLFDGIGVHGVVAPKTLPPERQREIVMNFFSKLRTV
jgi:AcrR family transcriptional regulator